MKMLIFIAIGLAVLLGVAFFIFWIAMIIDCCRRRFNKGMERLFWLIILLFPNIVSLLIYYLLIKKYHPEGLIDKDGTLR